MTNIKHSSKSKLWYTPTTIVEDARVVLGSIDLDPASDAFGNSRIKANHFYNELDNGLEQSWVGNVWVNPPGSKIGNKSLAALFWNKLTEEYNSGKVPHAIFMGFSLEIMQTSQNYPKSVLDFPFCVPNKRIKFDLPNGKKTSPTHGNVIVYLPKTSVEIDLFKKTFEKYGRVIIP